MYTSDSDQLMGYTGEGGTTELCKWTVDQSSLPTFKHAAMSQTGGFYTGELFFAKQTMHSDDTQKEFELGLELDGAEVRVILLCNTEEWGRLVISTFCIGLN